MSQRCLHTFEMMAGSPFTNDCCLQIAGEFSSPTKFSEVPTHMQRCPLKTLEQSKKPKRLHEKHKNGAV